MLPAISDIARHVPQARLEWIVEEAFAEIPAWHPAISTVIPVAHRRWRKAWWSAPVRAERAALAQRLRSERYDVILDMQALMKSVWLVRQARGVRHGLDWRSAREPLASLFYDVKHRVEFWQPAVTRQRELAAQTFGYTYEGAPNFGLQHFAVQDNQASQDVLSRLASDQGYVVIMPSASREDKLWPAEDWRAVMNHLRQTGCALRLLAGNEAEASRAAALIDGIDQARVLPRMSLTEIARELAGARMMVGLDSGLTHLSAALGRPTLGIYRASTPVRTPLIGSSFTASLGDRGAAPTREAVLAAVDQALAVDHAWAPGRGLS